MKKLLIILFVLILTNSHSQTLVADETTLKVNKTSFTIRCENDSINTLIQKNLGKTCVFKSVTQTLKQDRAGYYYQISYLMDMKYWNDIVYFFNKLNKKP